MQGIRSFSPVLRAIGVIGVVAALVTSVTFAALNDSASLTGNTLSTTTADLQVYDFTGAAWEDTAEGFDWVDLVPGEYGDSESFYLRNNGGVDLDVSVSATDPDPTEEIDPEDIMVKIEAEEACGDPALEETLATLIAGSVALPCGELNVGEAGNAGVPGTPGNYSVTVMVAYDGVDGAGPFTVDSFDFVFDGVQTVAP